MAKYSSRVSWTVLAGALALGLGALSAACGGGSGSSGGTGGPSSVTVISRSTGSVGPIGATITMTSAGVNPSSVTISVGQSVTFINNDTRAHEIASDPHPNHGSCPAMEAGLGTLQPGQTRSTQGFADAGRCTFHDHLDDGNRGFQGTITIQ
jgi:plastocyanin